MSRRPEPLPQEIDTSQEGGVLIRYEDTENSIIDELYAPVAEVMIERMSDSHYWMRLVLPSGSTVEIMVRGWSSLIPECHHRCDIRAELVPPQEVREGQEEVRHG